MYTCSAHDVLHAATMPGGFSAFDDSMVYRRVTESTKIIAEASGVGGDTATEHVELLVAALIDRQPPVARHSLTCVTSFEEIQFRVDALAPDDTSVHLFIVQLDVKVPAPAAHVNSADLVDDDPDLTLSPLRATPCAAKFVRELNAQFPGADAQSLHDHLDADDSDDSFQEEEAQDEADRSFLDDTEAEPATSGEKLAAEADMEARDIAERTQLHHYIVAITQFPAPLRELDVAVAREVMWRKVSNSTTVSEAMTIVQHTDPQLFFTHGDSVRRNVALLLKQKRLVSRAPRREICDFNHTALDLSRSVLLSGASNVGKTAFAKAHGLMPYLIKTLDQLLSIPDECDLLIFDDMRFGRGGLELTPEEMLSLLDVEETGSIKCRHFDGQIPCLPRIFTTNLDPSSGYVDADPFPLGHGDEQKNALKRRYIRLPYIQFLLYGPEGVVPTIE